MASVTLSNPTEDGYIRYLTSYEKKKDTEKLCAGRYLIQTPWMGRAYVEWDISSIPDNATINVVKFKYHGSKHASDCEIREMLGTRPSTTSNAQSIWDEIGEGTVYASPSGFPEEGANKEVDLGSSAASDLQSQLSADWFAIGIRSLSEENPYTLNEIYAEEYGSADPKPTLYVEYTEPSGLEIQASTTVSPTLNLTYSLIEVLKIQPSITVSPTLSLAYNLEAVEALVLGGVQLQRVLDILKMKSQIIAEKLLPGSDTPHRTVSSHMGLTWEIRGTLKAGSWSQFRQKVETLEGLADGQPKTFLDYFGCSHTVIISDVEVKRKAGELYRGEYVIRFYQA